MKGYKCYRHDTNCLRMIQKDRDNPKEEAWLILPTSSRLPAYWVRSDGTFIRAWTGSTNRPEEPVEHMCGGFSEVTAPGYDVMINPDLLVDVGL